MSEIPAGAFRVDEHGLPALRLLPPKETRAQYQTRAMEALRRASLAFLVLLALLCPVTLAAQPAPLVGSTLRTTSTAAGSVRVGCTQSGACTGGITAGPIDVASVTSAGFIGIAANVPASCVNRLVNTAGTLSFNCITLATGASLSGTLNTIPVFTSANSVGNSIMTQSGTTITVASTLTATTLGGTLSTVSQPNITTMAGLTTAGALATVGTITSGTWNGTIITLARGGTGVDLSGTGGTSQFLRQNTVGGTVTVVRPAIGDLSDGTNVALLNAANVFTASPQTVGSGGTGATTAVVTLNGGSASSGGSLVNFNKNSVAQTSIGTESAILANTSNDFSIFTATGVGIKFSTAGTLRWGVNAAGDWAFGASSHIADSGGTPTISVGFGSAPSIVGQDYAFVVTIGSTTTTGGLVTFGHTFTAAPVCLTMESAGDAVPLVTTSTTAVSITIASGTHTGHLLSVLCRGF